MRNYDNKLKAGENKQRRTCDKLDKPNKVQNGETCDNTELRDLLW